MGRNGAESPENLRPDSSLSSAHPERKPPPSIEPPCISVLLMGALNPAPVQHLHDNFFLLAVFSLAIHSTDAITVRAHSVLATTGDGGK